MSVTDNRITETQLNDLLCLAGQMQQKAEAVDDRDTAVMAFAVQTACSELSELRSEHAAAMSTITSIIEVLGTSDEISISGKVSALLAQRDALAAENAGLKELIEQHANSVAVCPNCSHEEPSETDDIVALYRSMETPATDAFLAEVRAQVCESICASLSAKSEEFESKAKEAEDFTTDNRYRFAAAMFRGFAAQLRQEAKCSG